MTGFDTTWKFFLRFFFQFFKIYISNNPLIFVSQCIFKKMSHYKSRSFIYGPFYAKLTTPKPSLFFIFTYAKDGHKKTTYINFQICLETSLAVMAEIDDLVLRAVIGSLDIYTINSLIKKKFQTNFLISKTLFPVARPKQKKNVLLLLLFKEVLSPINHFFNKISSYKHELLLKIVTLAMNFLRYGDEPLFFIAKFPDW